MLSFERLIREHRAIAVQSRDLRCAVANGADTTSAHDRLTALSDGLLRHLAAEDAEIYPRLMVSRDAGAALAARQAVVQFQTLAADWMAHLERWSVAAIAGDRPRFDKAMLAMLDRLDARIAQEDELLYPMALGAGHLALRDIAV